MFHLQIFNIDTKFANFAEKASKLTGAIGNQDNHFGIAMWGAAVLTRNSFHALIAHEDRARNSGENS